MPVRTVSTRPGLYRLRKNPMLLKGTTFRSYINYVKQALAAEGTSLAPFRIFSVACLAHALFFFASNRNNRANVQHYPRVLL